MSDIEKQFEEAAADAKTLAEKPDNETLLKLYALYKQGTDGDVHGEQPGFMDFVGRAKYEAWKELEGKDKNEAMQEYVGLVSKLKGRMA